MKVVREKTCIKCKVKKNWIDFSPVWGKTLEGSFIRRSCKACEPETPLTIDARAMERELARLLKKRTEWEAKIEELNRLMRERLQQIETANTGGEDEPRDDD